MTIRITIKTTGLSEAAKAFSSDRVGQILSKRFDEAARLLGKALERAAPKKSGTLAKGLYGQKVGRLHWVFGESGKGAVYGPFIRQGTRPHKIAPRVKKALWWPGLPHPVKRVDHPGITRKNDYPLTAIKSALPGMVKTLERVGDDINKL